MNKEMQKRKRRRRDGRRRMGFPFSASDERTTQRSGETIAFLPFARDHMSQCTDFQNRMLLMRYS